MTIIRIIWAEINGDALKARQAACREAARNNPNNPYLQTGPYRNHYIYANLGRH